MKTRNNIILAFTDFDASRSTFFDTNDETFLKYCSIKMNRYCRLLLALVQYLQHMKKFDSFFVYINNQHNSRLADGNFTGTLGKLNRSEIEIIANPINMHEEVLEMVDFSYPYAMDYHTFVTQNPKYTPQIFGICRMFSVDVWISLVFTFLALTVVYYLTLKKKSNFCKIFFHVLALLMKQDAIIIPSSFVEKILMYSWIFGAMVLCLAHDSVLLSFLSLPPLTKIKNLSDLAVSIQEGNYKAMAVPSSFVPAYLKDTRKEHIKVIADDILKDKEICVSLLGKFVPDDKTVNTAFNG